VRRLKCLIRREKHIGTEGSRQTHASGYQSVMIDTVLGVLCLGCSLVIFGVALLMTEERHAQLPQEPFLPGPIGRRTQRRLTRSVASARAFLAWRGLFFLIVAVVLFVV
jgi:hypothetical protein